MDSAVVQPWVPIPSFHLDFTFIGKICEPVIVGMVSGASVDWSRGCPFNLMFFLQKVAPGSQNQPPSPRPDTDLNTYGVCLINLSINSIRFNFHLLYNEIAC